MKLEVKLYKWDFSSPSSSQTLLYILMAFNKVHRVTVQTRWTGGRSAAA